MSLCPTVLSVAAGTLNLLCVCSVHADLTYQLTDNVAEQNGHSLTGQIVTTDSAPDDGVLDVGEVLSWNYSVSGPTPLAANDLATNILGIVSISPTAITLSEPTIDPSINELQLGVGNESLLYTRIVDIGGAGVFDIYRASDGNNEAWDFVDPVFEGALDGTWTIATLVPEPSGNALVASGIAMIALLRHRKR